MQRSRWNGCNSRRTIAVHVLAYISLHANNCVFPPERIEVAWALLCGQGSKTRSGYAVYLLENMQSVSDRRKSASKGCVKSFVCLTSTGRAFDLAGCNGWRSDRGRFSLE